MKILEVTCFALRNDGTLLIKTNMDQTDDSYRYCFYIYKGSETIFKSPYDRKSFLMYKVDEFGKYQIKAFVRNSDGTEKDSMVISYIVNKSNAKELAGDEVIEIVPAITVNIEKIKDNTVLVTATGAINEDMQFAWYIYNGEEKEPVFKSKYSKEPSISYIVKENGNFYAKLFVEEGSKKYTYKSNEVIINIIT